MRSKAWLLLFSAGLLLLVEGLARLSFNDIYQESPTEWLLKGNLEQSVIEPVADEHNFFLSTNFVDIKFFI